ncbi:hypothetical protein V6N11_028743 [Hibiscus sabdariffa]|uniref:Uncharacterized protein n=1 Tax=Hibiscus sabdariffa TaxID=183260 RepID=A0ABR2PR62_9ROSI
MLPSVALTTSARYISRSCPTIFQSFLFALFLVFLASCFLVFSQTLSTAAAMATSSSSSAQGLPSRFSSAAIRECYYNIVAAKNRWEEQGFMFDDGLENYGLEPIIYKRLNDLRWLRF